MALVQRTVHVATWPDGSGFRTLINSAQESALPIFTGQDELIEAAHRFAWVQSDGTVPAREVGAREALRHVVAHGLAFAVVDIASEHTLELRQAEIEPLLTPQARRDTSGPFAGVGRISSSVMQAVTASPSSHPPPPDSSPPGPSPGAYGPAAGSAEPTPRPAAEHVRLPDPTTPIARISAQPRRRTSSPPPGVTVQAAGGVAAPSGSSTATFGSGSSVTISPLRELPPDSLVDALSTVLRSFPEVEWAALCLTSRGPAGPLPTVGLRVDTGFRARVNDIISGLRQAGDAHGATLDVLLLDDPEVMRTARNEALVFYPWRRTPTLGR